MKDSRQVDSAAGPPPPASTAANSKAQSVVSPRSVTSNSPLLEAAKDEADPSLKVVVPASTAVTDPPAHRNGQVQAFPGLTINRETITIAGIGLVVALVTSVAGVACITALVALLTSPVWIPFATVTSPFWFPVALFTSPLWISGAALVALCAAWALFGGALIFAAFLFFAWPQRWLPSPSDKSDWFLKKRDEATLAVVKLQAKIVLYAAGVGPLADVALAITDRVDFVELQKALGEFDLAEFTDNMRKMDLGEMQAALMAAIRSVVGF